MAISGKSKKELIKEIEVLHRCLKELEHSEAERKRAEDALETERRRLYSLLDELPAFVYLQAPDHSVRFANHYFREHFGDPEEKRCYEILWGANEPCKPCPTFRVFDTKKPQVWEWDQSPDGRIYEINDYPFSDVDGSPLVLELGVDITERKKAEEVLQLERDNFINILDSMEDGIYIVDQNHDIQYVNPVLKKDFGSYEGRKCYEYFHDRKEICPWCKNEEVFAGKTVRWEWYSFKNQRTYDLIDTPLRNLDGSISKLEIFRDITEHKKAEESLRQSEERLKILFEYAPDAIYLIDQKGNFVDGNKAAEDMTGYTKEELIGKNLAQTGLLSPEQVPKALANLEKIAMGKPVGPDEYSLKRKDGSNVTVEIRTFPVRIGNQTLVLGIARDISARKKVEEKLLDYQAKLKSLASQLTLTEERERHHIATELHATIGQSLVVSKLQLDTLRASVPSGDLARTLEEVCNSLNQTIQNARSLTFDLSSPILYELGFETAVAEWLTERIQKNHGIATELEDDGQPKPLNDDIRAFLFRDVRELLINVVKHAQAEKIKVSIRKVGKQICVSVEDDGRGFNAEDIAVMAARKGGFGLFSIRERLEQLGGHFEIESEPGRGTKVTMTAPLKCEKITDGA